MVHSPGAAGDPRRLSLCPGRPCEAVRRVQCWYLRDSDEKKGFSWSQNEACGVASTGCHGELQGSFLNQTSTWASWGAVGA